MRLKHLFIGSMIGWGCLASCQDQLDYHEYSNDDKNLLPRTTKM